MAYTDKNRKNVGIKVFPTNSMVPKGETRNVLLHIRTETSIPSLIQATLFLKLCPV